MNSEQILQYELQGYREASASQLFGRTSQLHSGEVLYDGGYREGDAAEVFGPDSTLVASESIAPYEPSLCSEPLYQIAIVTTLVVYLYMMLRSWHFLRSMWSGVFGKFGERRMADEGGALPLAHFKRVALIIGAVLTTLIAINLADEAIPASSTLYVNNLAWLATPVSLLLVAVVAAWVYALHVVVEWVVRSDTMSMLASIGYINIVRAVVVLYPFVVVWLLSHGQNATIFGIIALILFIAELLIYLKETFLLFTGKNISIFYWILYLCTAILLPMSFLIRILPERLG